VSATRCIEGFKPVSSSAKTINGIVNGAAEISAAINGLITGYSGGFLPMRQCGQIGNWLQPNSNICVRIKCPAINPPTPVNSSDLNSWKAWSDSGGATFPSVNASRSKDRIQKESISIGTCNEALGFFKMPGSNDPTRECDYLGNWREVINPCTTKCDAISTESEAKNENNGFAYWKKVDSIKIGEDKDGEIENIFGSNGCVSGYKPYPYPAQYDKYGNKIPYDGLKTIEPLAIAQYPERVCKYVSGSSGSWASVWTSTSSVCVNGCPGYDIDSRIGVGVTRHSTRKFGLINVEWRTTKFNNWAEAVVKGSFDTNHAPTINPSLENQNATHYSGNNRSTNGYYVLSRYCNSDGKWSEPIPSCATNNEVISGSNAKYNNPPEKVGVGEIASGYCNNSAGYYKANYDKIPVARYRCQYRDSNKNLDELYFEKFDGEPCEEYCKIENGKEFGNSKYYGENRLLKKSDWLTLSCKENYGSQEIGGSRDVESGNLNCGRRYSTDRNSQGPAIQCSGANQIGRLDRDCTPCRNCNYNSSIEGSTQQEVSVSCSTERRDSCGNTSFCREDKKYTFYLEEDIKNTNPNHSQTQESSRRAGWPDNEACYAAIDWKNKYYCSCNTWCIKYRAKFSVNCVDNRKFVSMSSWNDWCQQNGQWCGW
jgi:hypothetical protein